MAQGAVVTNFCFGDTLTQNSLDYICLNIKNINDFGPPLVNDWCTIPADPGSYDFPKTCFNSAGVEVGISRVNQVKIPPNQVLYLYDSNAKSSEDFYKVIVGNYYNKNQTVIDPDPPKINFGSSASVDDPLAYYSLSKYDSTKFKDHCDKECAGTTKDICEELWPAVNPSPIICNNPDDKPTEIPGPVPWKENVVLVHESSELTWVIIIVVVIVLVMLFFFFFPWKDKETVRNKEEYYASSESYSGPRSRYYM